MADAHWIFEGTPLDASRLINEGTRKKVGFEIFAMFDVL